MFIITGFILTLTQAEHCINNVLVEWTVVISLSFFKKHFFSSHIPESIGFD
jgi:hypothetical protein